MRGVRACVLLVAACGASCTTRAGPPDRPPAVAREMMPPWSAGRAGREGSAPADSGADEVASGIGDGGTPPGNDGASAALEPDAGGTPPSPRAPDRRWSRIREPATGPSQAIGAYARGCLQGAVPLETTTDAFVVMRRSRRRYFGHPTLVAFVRRLAAGAKRNGAGTVYVGDLAQPRGGPTLTGHASHQTGLDVDILFVPPKPGGARLTLAERESLPARAIVDIASGAPTRVFSDVPARLVALAASDDAVDRLFVHAGVKKKLCAAHAGAAWMGRVRPWWGHHDHFHVRLKCPAASPGCEAQPPLPKGDGCDAASLDWWFSAEAKTGPTRKDDAVPPPLPAACEALAPAP